MEYYLYPPFFTIESEDFSDAWEILCCRLLNLKNETYKIARIKPPDKGVDLFWQTERIAFQCKAVHYGKRLDLEKVRCSINRAKANKAEIGWSNYVLCTNINLTAPTRKKIKDMLEEPIEFIGENQWKDLCEQFHDMIASYFHACIKVSQNRILRSIKSTRFQKYIQEVQDASNTPPINVLVCSNRYEEIFKLPLSPGCSISNLINILRELLELPEEFNDERLNFSMYLRYSIVIDDKMIPLHEKLDNLASRKKLIVTLWKQIVVKDTQGYSEENTMQLLTPNSIRNQTALRSERLQVAVSKYKEEVNQSFKRAVERLQEEKHL